MSVRMQLVLDNEDEDFLGSAHWSWVPPVGTRMLLNAVHYEVTRVTWVAMPTMRATQESKGLPYDMYNGEPEINLRLKEIADE